MKHPQPIDNYAIFKGYKPNPKLKGKRIGALVRLYAIEGKEEAYRDALRVIVDQVIPEPTCLILKAAQSIKHPQQFILYEEWADYDNFFTVQVNRSYRNKFPEMLAPISTQPSHLEFFEIFHSKQKSVQQISQMDTSERFVVIANTQLKRYALPIIRKLLTLFINAVNKNPTNLSLTAQQSLSIPGHIINYEEWIDLENFVTVEMNHFSRRKFKKAMNNPDTDQSTSLEFFRLFHEGVKQVNLPGECQGS